MCVCVCPFQGARLIPLWKRVSSYGNAMGFTNDWTICWEWMRTPRRLVFFFIFFGGRSPTNLRWNGKSTCKLLKETYIIRKKSCTTLDDWQSINTGISHLSTGARFLPSPVCTSNLPRSLVPRQLPLFMDLLHPLRCLASGKGLPVHLFLKAHWLGRKMWYYLLVCISIVKPKIVLFFFSWDHDFYLLVIKHGCLGNSQTKWRFDGESRRTKWRDLPASHVWSPEGKYLKAPTNGEFSMAMLSYTCYH